MKEPIYFYDNIEREYWTNRFEHAEKANIMSPEDYADEKLLLFRTRNVDELEVMILRSKNNKK